MYTAIAEVAVRESNTKLLEGLFDFLNILRFSLLSSSTLIGDKINKLFPNGDLSNLTHEILYDNFNNKQSIIEINKADVKNFKDLKHIYKYI